VTFQLTFKKFKEQLDLTNDGKLFHSFGAAACNGRDAVAVLMLEAVVSQLLDDN